MPIGFDAPGGLRAMRLRRSPEIVNVGSPRQRDRVGAGPRRDDADLLDGVLRVAKTRAP